MDIVKKMLGIFLGRRDGMEERVRISPSDDDFITINDSHFCRVIMLETSQDIALVDLFGTTIVHPAGSLAVGIPLAMPSQKFLATGSAGGATLIVSK